MILRLFINSFLGRFPMLEVIIRKTYWSSNFLIKLKNKPLKKKSRQNINLDKFSLQCFFDKLRDIGLKENDLVIVHSSYGELKSNISNLSGPNEIVDGFLNIIGTDGTLAFPTHPKYEPEIISKDIMKDVDYNGITEYDIKNTKAWTGVLANAFLTYPNVVRSRHPINSMAALGPLAYDIMKDNILGDKPLACGENSSWKFCSDRNAMIIGLGVDLVHSLTMIHVAEDNDPINFPKDKWYRDRKFRIIDGDYKTEIVVGERKPKWATHYAERRFRRDLINDGIMKVAYINEFCIEYINDSKKLINYLKSKNSSGFPYWGINIKTKE